MWDYAPLGNKKLDWIQTSGYLIGFFELVTEWLHRKYLVSSLVVLRLENEFTRMRARNFCVRWSQLLTNPHPL